MTQTILHVPGDIVAASEEWGANCGPAALAAIAGRSLSDVRPYLAGFESRRYCNPTHIRNAAIAMGLSVEPSSLPRWPRRGLVFIQWGGPWLRPGVPIGAAYRNTHWVASIGPAVFDVNVGYWVSRDDWTMPRDGVAAWIIKHVKRADGTWRVRWSCEIAESEVEVF